MILNLTLLSDSETSVLAEAGTILFFQTKPDPSGACEGYSAGSKLLSCRKNPPSFSHSKDSLLSYITIANKAVRLYM